MKDEGKAVEARASSFILPPSSFVLRPPSRSGFRRCLLWRLCLGLQTATATRACARVSEWRKARKVGARVMARSLPSVWARVAVAQPGRDPRRGRNLKFEKTSEGEALKIMKKLGLATALVLTLAFGAGSVFATENSNSSTAGGVGTMVAPATQRHHHRRHHRKARRRHHRRKAANTR